MTIFTHLLCKVKWPKMGIKMAIKQPQMLQMSWNLDQTCISMSFIKFQKIFEKLTNLARHLARFARYDFRTRNTR